MTANDRQVEGSHYKSKAIQPWDFIAANNLGYFEGNIVKYVSRWRDKGGVKDLEKARHYLDKLIELSSTEKPNDAIVRAVTGKSYEIVELKEWLT